jgi:hypothetical protein
MVKHEASPAGYDADRLAGKLRPARRMSGRASAARLCYCHSNTNRRGIRGESGMKSGLIAVALMLASPAWAHHSYAMFDGARTLTVSGTVAKLEWMNPHVFLWVYVPNAKAREGYDLYAFENGSPNVLTRLGWTKNSLTAGEKVVVKFWPLKDGRNGGHFVTATDARGQVLHGAGGPNSDKGGGAEGNLLKKP